MSKNTAFAIAVFSKWFGTGIAVSVGLCVTKNFHCLWFMVIPLLVSEETRDKENEVE